MCFDLLEGTHYSKITPILVEAIKEQQKIIDSLIPTIASLKMENAVILNEVKNLKTDYSRRVKKLEDILGAKAEKGYYSSFGDVMPLK